MGRRGFPFLNPSDTGANLRSLGDFQINFGELRKDPVIRGETRDRSGIDPSLKVFGKANKEMPVFGLRSDQR